MIFFFIYYIYKSLNEKVFPINIDNENLIEPIKKLQYVYNSNDSIKVLENRNAKVGVEIIDNVLNFYFIGTNDLIDLCEDLNIIQTDFIIDNVKYGKVHSGFLDYYRTINSYIINYIENTKDNINEINLYGHSLGSVCVFAAFELYKKNIFKNIKVVTFGSPKLGDATFVKHIDETIPKNIRIVLKNDIISKLPSKWIRYFHCGIEKQIYNKGFLTHSLSYYHDNIIKTLSK